MLFFVFIFMYFSLFSFISLKFLSYLQIWVAFIDLNRRYRLMRDKLKDNKSLQDITLAPHDKDKDHLTRFLVLEKKLNEAKQNLNSTFHKVDILKKNKENLILEKANLLKVVDNLKFQLSQADRAKKVALDELQAKFTLTVKSQIQDAYNLGQNQALEKYNIVPSDHEDDSPSQPDAGGEIHANDVGDDGAGCDNDPVVHMD